jgi:uncharacterized protein (TIGR03067 family)
MRTSLTTVTALFLVAVAGGAQTADDSAAEPDLNGVWRGYVVEGKGEQPDRGPTHLELTIKDHQIAAQRLDGEAGPLGEGTYKIRAGKLMQMDATQTSAQGKRLQYLGICKLVNGQLHWCVSTPRNRRPAQFQTRGQQFLLILKRS